MSDGFVPLGAFLRPPRVVETPPPLGDPGEEAFSNAGDFAHEYAEVFGAIRRFRAGIADTLDAAVQRLLVQIAEEVLARELQIAPPEIAAIVAKARERAAPERLITVRVHPAQRNALATLHLETHADERLGRGDVVLELRNGTIDLRLRTRLIAALAACER